MIPWIGALLQPLFGPFRLFGSRVFLIGVGASLAAFLTWWLLPRLWSRLPTDQVRAHAVGAQESAGQAGRRGPDLHIPVRRDLLPVRPLRCAGHRAPGLRPPGDDRRVPGRPCEGRLARVPPGRGGFRHLPPGSGGAVPASALRDLASGDEGAAARQPLDLHPRRHCPDLAHDQRHQLHRRRGRALGEPRPDRPFLSRGDPLRHRRESRRRPLPERAALRAGRDLLHARIPHGRLPGRIPVVQRPSQRGSHGRCRLEADRVPSRDARAGNGKPGPDPASWPGWCWPTAPRGS